jgi:MFS transporter, YNFM family, putative membrane transport protein
MSMADIDHARVASAGSTSAGRSLLVGLTAFLTVVDLFATQAILPSLTRSYGVTPAAMSLAVNASTLGMAIASILTALFAHRLERRRSIVLSLVVLAVPTLLLSVAPNLATFAALRVAQGLCMASAFTLTLAYLGERFDPGEAAGAFAAYITGNVASNLVGRLMSASIADHYGLAANFIVFAALNLAGAALVYRSMATAPRPAGGNAQVSIGAAVVRHLADRQLLAAFATGFCILFAFIGTFTYVNFVLVGPTLGLSMMQLGLVYLVFLPSMATTLLAGTGVRRIGTRPSLWLGLAVAGAGLILALAVSLTAVLTGLALVAVGTFFAQAVATGFVGRTATTDRGAASGLYLACYFSGGLVGTAVLGSVFDQWGWPACVGGIAVAITLAGLMGLAMKEKR